MSESNDQFEKDHRKTDPFEAELGRLLKPKQPSPEFAARVLSAARNQDAPRLMDRWRRFAIAAALFAMVSSGALYLRHMQAQEAAAEKAGRQALIALRITAGTLAVAREKVLQVGALSVSDDQSRGERSGEKQTQGDEK